MTLPTKIVVIGAGSASFGLNTLAALLGSQRLRGSHLALVDKNEATLNLVGRFAQRLNDDWQAGIQISLHSHHTDALAAAQFVVLAIEVSPRETLWRSDFEIPLKYGVRQPYAENGGPGGFAHAARNIGPVLDIVRDMEQVCPNAWLINYTNPMMRICDTINRYSSIRAVGLCHQLKIGYALVGLTLADELGIQIPAGFVDTHASPLSGPPRRQVAKQALQKVTILAAGLNHFTWILAIHDKHSGEDLYPRFAERWAALDPNFEPLTRRVYGAFGLLPTSGDEHLCEYLPWVSDPLTKPWEKYEISLYDWDYWESHRTEGYAELAAMAEGRQSLETLRQADSEGALEIIENIAAARTDTHLAVNLPNQGYISNLPPEAIVEVPGVVSGAGVQGVGVGDLPEGIAELCRREITAIRLGVDAAVKGDRKMALQSLLLSPSITDLDVAQQILDDYLETYRQHLPQFWQ